MALPAKKFCLIFFFKLLLVLSDILFKLSVFHTPFYGKLKILSFPKVILDIMIK